jgi:hypothetical protein
MTANQKAKFIAELKNLLTKNGYQADTFGNFKQEFAGKLYRFKFGKSTLRYEVKGSLGSWVRLKSGYYGKLAITANEQIAGLTK